jgi:hypothetical protein
MMTTIPQADRWMTLTRAIMCNNLSRAERVWELIVSGQPFKYASPSNDPAIIIHRHHGFVAWHQISVCIRERLPPDFCFCAF